MDTSNELLERDGSFLTAEKYLDERMFVNILGFLKIDNEEEREEIFTSELPAEVLDDKFTFIRMEEPIQRSKSVCSSPTSPQKVEQKPPRITKPTMKEILDGSYNKKIQKEALKRNPILLLSKNTSDLSLEDEPTISIEEIVEAEIVCFYFQDLIRNRINNFLIFRM